MQIVKISNMSLLQNSYDQIVVIPAKAGIQ